MVAKRDRDNVALHGLRESSDSKQDNPRGTVPLSEDQVPEVLVLRQQSHSQPFGDHEYPLVLCTRCGLSNVQNVMPIKSQTLYDLSIDAFVRKDPH